MRFTTPAVCGLCLVTSALCSKCPAPLVLQLANCSIAGTAVHSWGIRLDLADPPQHLCLVPSTVVNSTLVLGADFCQTNPNLTVSQCQSLSGNTFNISAAASSYATSSASELLSRNPVWRDISPEPLDAGTTLLRLPPGASQDNSIPDYLIGVITGGSNQNVGHFGLATDSDFLASALSNGIIPAKGFGLNSGSQSVANPRGGALVLGGYDLASIDGAFNHYPIAATDLSERQCPFQVTITQLVIRIPTSNSSKDLALTSPGILIPACVEPYDNLFRFPQTILDAFKAATGWSSDTVVDPSLHIAEPGLNYPLTSAFKGSLLITLQGGFQVEIPNEELSNPLRGIDTSGVRVLQPNITEVAIFSESALLNTAVLGKAYFAVDYTTGQFSLAPIVSGSVDVNVVPFNTTSAYCSDTSGQTTWKYGVGFGVGLGVPALVVLVVLAVRNRLSVKQWPKQLRQMAHQSQPTDPQGGGPDRGFGEPQGAQQRRDRDEQQVGGQVGGREREQARELEEQQGRVREEQPQEREREQPQEQGEQHHSHNPTPLHRNMIRESGGTPSSLSLSAVQPHMEIREAALQTEGMREHRSRLQGYTSDGGRWL